MIRLNMDYNDVGVYYESTRLLDGLGGVYTAIGHLPYKVLGIDVEKIRSMAMDAEGADMIAALQGIKMPRDACGADYRPLCESIVFEALVERYYDSAGGIIPKNNNTVGTTPARFKNKLFFVCDEKEWVAVKKMSVQPDTTPREVAAFMLGVRASVLAKYMELKYPEAAVTTELEKKIGKKRKSMGALAELFAEYGKNAAKFIVVANVLGYSATPTHETLKKVFSELKLPGIRGRLARG